MNLTWVGKRIFQVNMISLSLTLMGVALVVEEMLGYIPITKALEDKKWKTPWLLQGNVLHEYKFIINRARPALFKGCHVYF